MQGLIEKVEKFGSPRVLLIGDFMLDRYVYGDVERISPEAPVPVLRVVRREARPGGAGNVSNALLALGAKVVCLGVTGQDEACNELCKLLSASGADTSALLKLPDRPTIVKTRCVGLAQHRHAQQILRIDEEVSQTIRDDVQTSLKAVVRTQVRACDIVAIEDHDKGLLGNNNAPAMIAEARKVGKMVVVDPACISDYRRYRGATLLTPNRYEAELASGVKIVDEPSMERAARQIIAIAELESVVITLDREGAYLLTRDGLGMRVPTRPRAVYDVTGAGDEVLAMLTMAIAEKLELPDAVALANVVGGLEVEKFGVVPIPRQEVVDELRRVIGMRSGKLIDRKKLMEEVARRKSMGQTVVFTNGCFDLIHMGHIRFIQEARRLGHCLVVAINSDAGVRKLKGAPRPIMPQDERAELLASLEWVDYVTVFDEDTPETLIELLRPDILVKSDQTKDIVGRQIVEKYGGKVMSLTHHDGHSTSEIINKVSSGA